MKVGFIGLGRMGEVMTRRLIEAGHEVGVYNRNAGQGQAAGRCRRQGGQLDQGGRAVRRRGFHDGVRRCRRVASRWPAGRPRRLAAERRHSHLRRHAQRRRHPEAQGDSRRGRANPDRLADARPPGSGRGRSGRHCRRRAAGRSRPLPAVVHGHCAACRRCRPRAGRRRRHQDRQQFRARLRHRGAGRGLLRWCANTASRRTCSSAS